jgi:hypothetical protein
VWLLPDNGLLFMVARWVLEWAYGGTFGLQCIFMAAQAENFGVDDYKDVGC